jgi:acetyltransferase-like isoleucine patch superfamily enzyme
MIHPTAVIYDGTIVGEGCEIQAGAIVGKPPKLARSSTAARAELPPLQIGAGAVICAQAIVFAGTTLGDGAIVGDQAFARVKLQTQVYITAYMTIEDDVFVGPGVTATNDDTMGRHPPGAALAGPVLRRACRIGGGVTLCPGVEIGEDAFIAAGAVVTRDVPARGVAMGVPARVVRSVSDADLLDRWR